MLVLDEKLRVKTANKSFYKKFHTKITETEGKSVFEFGNKLLQIPVLKRILKEVCIKNKYFVDFELTHSFPKIGEKIMLLNVHKIIRRKHNQQLILLAMSDITERSRIHAAEKEFLKNDIRLHKEDKVELDKALKRRTRQLEQRNKELENINKDLTTLTYVSSHDLQEPMRKIQTYATCILLEEEKSLSANGKGYFLRLREVAQRMQTLIEDLLKYSRSKDNAFNLEDTDLHSLLNEVISDFESKIDEKKANVETEHLGHIKIIRFQFRQVFHNLISNSLKFAKTDVPVIISIQGKVINGSKAKNKFLKTKKYLHITYTDNGIGFEPKYKERIFEVFQRLHSPDEYEGTGIGLAICKRIVENHKGLITANGKLNKGARFDIYIPVN